MCVCEVTKVRIVWGKNHFRYDSFRVRSVQVRIVSGMNRSGTNRFDYESLRLRIVSGATGRLRHEAKTYFVYWGVTDNAFIILFPVKDWAP